MKRVLALVLMLGLALAAPIEEVEIKGADTVLGALIRISLPFGVGDEPGNLEQARAAVLATGFFREASVRMEGPKLVVEVTPNPPITKVSVNTKAFPESSVLRYLETEQAIGVGSVYNPKRAAEAAENLARVYRTELFPFIPKITPQTKEVTGGIELNFDIEESPALKEVQLGEVSYIDKAALELYFKAINNEGKFSFDRYRDAVTQTSTLYANAGFRGSGVNLAQTNLQDGVLKVVFSELRIGEINAKDLDVSSLGLKVGDPFNVDKILDGINALSRSISRVVEFNPERTGENEVRLNFAAGAQRYGAIREVRLEGNTVIPREKLVAALRLKAGDEFSPVLAQEDYGRILKLYRDAGYELVGQPNIGFDNGVYVQRIREVKIAGYVIEPPLTRTDAHVFLREMPAPGSLLSVGAIRQGITNILRTGLLAEPPQVRPQPTEKPDEVTLVLSFKEGRTLSIQPSIGATNISGAWTLEGNFSVSETNLWGLAHAGSLSFGANTNDAGQVLNFSAGYRIPWLYLDFGDLKEVRTGLSFSVFSTPTGNNRLPLEQQYGGSTPDLNGDGVINDADRTSIWEFTERRTGFGLNLSRQFSKELPNLTLSAGLSYEWVVPYLETGDANRPRCYRLVPELDAGGNPRTNPDGTPVLRREEITACSDALTDDARNRLATLNPAFQTVRLNLGASYTQLDNFSFPTQGFTIGVSTGYGLTFPDNAPMSQFVPISVTGRNFFRLDEAGRQALILRLSAGTILGTPQPTQRFSLGGNSSDLTTLRGYDPKFLENGTTLLSGSLEYAYDFGLNPTGGTTVYGYLFADFGRVWPATTQPDAFFLGAGFGVQVNLDLLGAVLPPIRLDYGFSERYPSGRFAIRLGPTF